MCTYSQLKNYSLTPSLQPALYSKIKSGFLQVGNMLALTYNSSNMGNSKGLLL